MRPRLYISATRKSSGKTMLSAGLCGALRARGLEVQSYKKGPDYIDPMWLSRLSGRPCYNLDFNTQGHEEIRSFFSDRLAGADVGLIEGNKGLFDGVDVDGADCNAALAGLLDTAVVLVIDCDGMTRGIAPMINGYQSFDEGVQIDAVILNRIGGSRHESKLRAIVEGYTDVEVVGAVRRDRSLTLTERHLGLVPVGETQDVDLLSRQLVGAVEAQIDIDRLLELGQRPDLAVSPKSQETPETLPLHIGVAKDSAFCFYYPDDLDTLQRQVSRVSYFSPLTDSRLPDCDALFIGGGFPETHAEQLHANVAMRQAIRGFANSGRPIYAECGGLMYLGRSLATNARRFDMAGALPIDTTMHERPVGRGYVEIVPSSSHPWFGGDAKDVIRGHEFHYSSVVIDGKPVDFAYRVQRGHGIDGSHDGLLHGNIFAGYAHLRHTQDNPWITRFLQSVARRHAAAA